eukprot:CAMPEP_0172779570 /NCGR_PEP_ID=MMETSP1074-20121228/202485_1 /TAXON_ID=2916 /ORGANISM="Ceratium fusus, Strain PA161109" /LENGTH=439 /DNA_ID=CAMNT_0013616533 /DNA_START=57 /DNA_END=1376 /DNA_ORIENTATION=-
MSPLALHLTVKDASPDVGNLGEDEACQNPPCMSFKPASLLSPVSSSDRLTANVEDHVDDSSNFNRNLRCKTSGEHDSDSGRWRRSSTSTEVTLLSSSAASSPSNGTNDTPPLMQTLRRSRLSAAARPWSSEEQHNQAPQLPTSGKWRRSSTSTEVTLLSSSAASSPSNGTNDTPPLMQTLRRSRLSAAARPWSSEEQHNQAPQLPTSGKWRRSSTSTGVTLLSSSAASSREPSSGTNDTPPQMQTLRRSRLSATARPWSSEEQYSQALKLPTSFVENIKMVVRVAKLSLHFVTGEKHVTESKAGSGNWWTVIAYVPSGVALDTKMVLAYVMDKLQHTAAVTKGVSESKTGNGNWWTLIVHVPSGDALAREMVIAIVMEEVQHTAAVTKGVSVLSLEFLQLNMPTEHGFRAVLCSSGEIPQHPPETAVIDVKVAMLSNGI